MKADEITLKDFARVIWEERGQFMRFLSWTDEMREYAKSSEKQGKR